MLDEYSNFISYVAICATIPLMLSPSQICSDFITRGSSDHIKPFIFITGFIRCVLFLQHAILLNIHMLCLIQSFGVSVHIVYLALYLAYATDKKKVSSFIVATILFLSIPLAYANSVSSHLVTQRFGIFAVAMHFIFLGSPLLNVKKMIREKNSNGLHFPITLCTFIVCCLWLLYGISINVTSLIVQMSMGILMTGCQLVLSIKYPAREIPAAQQDKKLE